MEDPIKELGEDIQELQQILEKSATRKNVKTLMTLWIEKLEAEKKKMETVMESATPKKIDPVQNAINKIDTMVFETIAKFGWDDEGKKVKIYITSGIDGVGSIPKDNITCEFEDQSLDLKIQDLKGKNFRLRFPKLQHEIEIAECKFNIKTNGISITLFKKDKGEKWTDLKPKKSLVDSAKDVTKKGTDKDAYGDLMSMMKNMYENGDDDTKRMISESWQKSQDKGGAKGDMSPGEVRDAVSSLKKQ